MFPPLALTPDSAVSRTRAPRRVLIVFLAASVAIHATVIVFAPEFSLEFLLAGPAPLEVIIERPQPRLVEPAEPVAAPSTVSPPAPRRKVPARPPSPPRAPMTAVPVPLPESPIAAPEPQPQPVPEPQLSAPAPQASTAKIPVTPPSHMAAYLRNPPPSYPTASRAAGEEGTVVLRVRVKRDGLPGRVDISKSSGWHNLDAVARDAVWKWRFVPAREGKEPVEATMDVPITFRLKDAGEGLGRSR